MKRIFLFIGLLFFSSTTFAIDLTHYHRRFELQINQAGERVIVDKTILENISLEAYIKNLADYLMEAQLNRPYDLPACKGVEYERPDPNAYRNFERAFEWLKKTNIGKLLTDEKFIKFLKDLQLLADQYTKDPDYVVMANLDNPTFFYSKQFGKFLQKQIRSLIKSQLELAPYAKVITYISDDYIRLILAKKNYHQNILRFYLEASTANELGLTELEINRALSSIEDSRLSFGFSGIRDSRKIKKDFDGYGFKRWEKSEKDAEKRWTKHEKLFDSRLDRLTSTFSLVSYSESPIIINNGNKKDRGNDRPSYTYDKECPKFVYTMRKNYELIRVVLGMSPVPYSSRLFSLFKSRYQPQAMSEAALVGYFESTGRAEEAAIIQKQSINPLL